MSQVHAIAPMWHNVHLLQTSEKQKCTMILKVNCNIHNLLYIQCVISATLSHHHSFQGIDEKNMTRMTVNIWRHSLKAIARHKRTSNVTFFLLLFLMISVKRTSFVCISRLALCIILCATVYRWKKNRCIQF